jgi:hypothetical protein
VELDQRVAGLGEPLPCAQSPASSDRSAPSDRQRRCVPGQGCGDAILFGLVTACLWDVQVRLSRGYEATR